MSQKWHKIKDFGLKFTWQNDLNRKLESLFNSANLSRSSGTPNDNKPYPFEIILHKNMPKIVVDIDDTMSIRRNPERHNSFQINQPLFDALKKAIQEGERELAKYEKNKDKFATIKQVFESYQVPKKFNHTIFSDVIIAAVEANSGEPTVTFDYHDREFTLRRKDIHIQDSGFEKKVMVKEGAIQNITDNLNPQKKAAPSQPPAFVEPEPDSEPPAEGFADKVGKPNRKVAGTRFITPQAQHQVATPKEPKASESLSFQEIAKMWELRTREDDSRAGGGGKGSNPNGRG